MGDELAGFVDCAHGAVPVQFKIEAAFLELSDDFIVGGKTLHGKSRPFFGAGVRCSGLANQLSFPKTEK